ncbi:MAG: protein-disulfide reductase DsbD domain-containing protein, partial [Candidatus Neomarinimicrobiota bacterium]
MKTIKNYLLLLALAVPLLLSAKFAKPAQADVQAPTGVRAGEVAEVEVTVTMERRWHIYGVYGIKGGPIATRIEVKGDAVKKAGPVVEPTPIVKFDEGFQVNTRFHQGTTVFKVPVLLRDDLTPGPVELTAEVLFQVCDATVCYPPETEKLPFSIVIEAGEPRPERMQLASVAAVDESGNIDLNEAISKGLFSFILLALSMGFLALLTPCVFPMIPITVSYFTHQGELEGRNPIKQASVYALGIIFTFSVLGLILALTLGAAGANQLAANPWVNLFIGGL